MVALVSLIDASDSRCQLGNKEIDRTHHEFIDLVNNLDSAERDEFVMQFQALLDHTRLHFSREKELMEKSNFPALTEHDTEHQHILGELDRFNNKVRNGQLTFARAYIREKLPGWFHLHISMMDSALVAHLNGTQSK